MKFHILWLLLALLLLSACAPAKESEAVFQAEPEVVTESPAWLEKELFLHFGRMGEDDPRYAHQYGTREYEKMQSFILCESVADYELFQTLCKELWPDGGYSGFPTLSEEFFAENQLVTLYLPFRANTREENAEATLRALWRYGKEGEFLCVDMRLEHDGEDELLPARNFPTQFGAMLIPIPRSEGEIRYVITNRITALKKDDLSGKLFPEVHTQFYRGIFESDLFEEAEPDDTLLSISPEGELSFSAEYANVVFSTNFLLLPSYGCHPEELSEVDSVEKYLEFVNRDYLAFFGEYELLPAEDFGGSTADTIGYRIPVTLTPEKLAEILEDPRVIGVGGDWKSPNTDHIGSGWVM